MIGWLIVLGILALTAGTAASHRWCFALDYDDPKDRFFLETVLAGHSAALQRGVHRFCNSIQTAVQCRNSAVLEQAYASGYRTAVQMFAAGLGPQPPIPEHEEDSNG